MSIHVTPIPRLTVLSTPAFTLGTTNTAGAAITAVASNSTILTYDATDPAAVAASAVVGTATTAARRDHVHVGGPAATQVQMEAASDNTVFATSGRTQYHPGVAKVWARVNFDTAPASLLDSYNISAFSDEGTGVGEITYDIDFGNANYSFATSAQIGSAYFATVDGTVAVGSSRVYMFNQGGTAADTKMAVAYFGDQ